MKVIHLKITHSQCEIQDVVTSHHYSFLNKETNQIKTNSGHDETNYYTVKINISHNHNQIGSYYYHVHHNVVIVVPITIVVIICVLNNVDNTAVNDFYDYSVTVNCSNIWVNSHRTVHNNQVVRYCSNFYDLMD